MENIELAYRPNKNPSVEIVNFFKLDNFLDAAGEFETKTLESESGVFTTCYLFNSTALLVREYDFYYNDDFCLHFRLPQNDWVEMSFYLSDHALCDRVGHLSNNYLPLHAYVTYAASYTPIEINYKKDLRYRHLDCYIPVQLFRELACQYTDIQQFVRQIDQKKCCRLFEMGIPINHSMLKLLQDIKQCPFRGAARGLFVYSKIYELLSLLLHSAAQGSQDTFAEHQSKTIQAVEQFLVINLHQFYSIDSLSKMFFINPSKLKSGFRERFGLPIFEYSQLKKMQWAQAQLREKKKSIKTIAFELGYSHPASFSKAFKKHFGCSPKDYLI